MPKSTMPKTYAQKPAEVKRTWHVVDVKERVLGQVATQIAWKLMGKHKPTYTPNVDGGDYVIVTNANAVLVTGNKSETKMYYNHSGFPGGLRERNFADVMTKKPAEIIERAVYTMLPSNRLRKDRMNRLKVFIGPEHTYQNEVEKK